MRQNLFSVTAWAARSRIALLLAALALAGCAGPRSHYLLPEPPATSSEGVAATHRIYVATTRAKADEPRQVYSRGRGDTPTFARIDISVPASHKVGAVERPRGDKPDPSKYFTARSLAGIPDANAFASQVVAQSRTEGGRIVVFVHGYNTSFDASVYRVTQIAHDAGYDGTPVLFSWASGGSMLDYVYDRDSATAARDALEQLIRSLGRAGAGRIDIVAHSMGTWLTMEALRQLAIAGDRDIGGQLGDVVLASPDIDVDVFKSQMRRYGVPDRPFFVLLSGDDRALRISSLIAGRAPRVGDYASAKDLASLGVIVVDLTKVKAGDSYNHTKFADNPLLVKLLGDRLREGDSLGTDERTLTDHIGLLARGVGGTLGSAAEIIITTPVNVISIAVGQ